MSSTDGNVAAPFVNVPQAPRTIPDSQQGLSEHLLNERTDPSITVKMGLGTNYAEKHKLLGSHSLGIMYISMKVSLFF